MAIRQKVFIGVFSALVLGSVLAATGTWAKDAAVTATTSEPAPRELTAEEDHRAMMEQLGIASLRPGANPNDPNAPNAVNYDEAKANPIRICPIHW